MSRKEESQSRHLQRQTVQVGHTLSSKLDAVAERVDEDLTQSEPIAEQGTLVRLSEILDKLEALLLCDHGEEPRVHEGVGEREGRRLERELARFDFAHVEDGADEVKQDLAAAEGLFDEGALILAQSA